MHDLAVPPCCVKIPPAPSPASRSPLRLAGTLAALPLLTLLLSSCGGAQAVDPVPQAAAPSTLSAATHLDGSTLYPRLVRLHHAPAALNNSILAKTGNFLYRSFDEGHTFALLTAVATTLPASAKSPAPDNLERCCSTLYELPRQLGALAPGTLLYSASFLLDDTPAIEIFASSDSGLTWSYLATPILAGNLAHGLWEPEFTLAADNSLVLFFSDETDPCCSQKLVAMTSTDGLRWSTPQNVVASDVPQDRPGMAVVSALPDHTWLLTYENCGPTDHCKVFFRTSTDGLAFGNPYNPGTPVLTATGDFLAHAPNHTFDPATGKLLLVGQVMLQSDRTLSPSNGRLVFTHLPPYTGPNAGPWATIPAPVEVPQAFDNFCPNYSSALLPTPAGLLELASLYDPAGDCTSFYATLSID